MKPGALGHLDGPCHGLGSAAAVVDAGLWREYSAMLREPGAQTGGVGAGTRVGHPVPCGAVGLLSPGYHDMEPGEQTSEM